MAPISFGRRTAQLAELHPDEPALVFADTDGSEQVVTWAELDARANQLARLLAAQGVRPGAMVAVALPNSPDHVAVDIAGWRLGACVLPLRPDLPEWERRRLLDVASPAAVVGDWPAEGHTAIGAAELEWSRSLSADAVEDHVPDPAFAIATSGSTGRPKLIVSPGPGVYDADAPTALQQGMGVARRPVQLVPAPMYHTNGYRICHLALDRGELVVLMARFDAAQAAALIERHQVTSVTMAPVMLLRLARLEGIEGRDLSSITSVLQGAASCPPWLVRWWIERVGPEHFFISYGASERVGLAFLRGDEWLAHPGSVGRGLNTDIRILDDDGKALPAGEVGEIFLRQTSEEPSGYFYVGAPPAKQTPDGFTSLGDMGWLDEDGYLYIADRRVDMIVTGGANVFPAEVEAALLEHPEVADCAVVGLPDEEWGARVHAVVQPRHPAHPPAQEDLRRHCRERLAAYKVPKTVSWMSPLPRTDAGKLNHGALAAQLTGDPG